MSKQVLIRSVNIAAVLLIIFFLTCTAAFAGDSLQGSPAMTLRPSGAEDGVLLDSTVVNGKNWFFLPSGVNKEEMQLVSGQEADFSTMQSSGIASVHFFSKDPESKGMDYIHQSKDNSAKGELFMYDENFDLVYQGNVDALKGRGNTTWGWTDKKSYQVKLEKKADLLDPAKGKQKAKKWLLLANPFDPTLMRNYMIYDFAREIGLENTPEGRPVDMYYDGEYRGSYYLCEKVEIGDGRVEINDLEKDVEDANPDADFDSLRDVSASNSKGLAMQYQDGISEPGSISGGYLLELDSVYYKEERSWFNYYGPGYATVKSPEFNSAGMMEHISRPFADASEYIVRSARNFEDGSQLSGYIDLDSFARFFLVNEWFANNDIWTSSTYIYKPEGEDLFYAGPVWDCDSSMRIQRGDGKVDSWFASTEGQLLGKQLLGLPVFRRKLQEVYASDMRPVIYDILLGSGSGKYLKPVARMKAELADSAAMNYMIWDINDCDSTYHPAETPEANYEDIMSWMQRRAEWFDEQIMSDSFVPNGIKVDQVSSVNTALNVSKRTCKVSFGKTSSRISNASLNGSKPAGDYRIAYRKAGTKKWKASTTGGKTAYTLKNLKAGAAYEIKVRALYVDGSQTVPGKYSAVKRILLRKVAPRLKAGRKSVTVSWSKVPEADRYQIRISTNKSFKSSRLLTVKASARAKRTIKNLKSGKTYYVKMRCYKTVNGQKYYTGWSAAKKIRL